MSGRRGRAWLLALGVLLVAIPVGVAVLGPFLAPHDPDAPLGPALGGPGTVGPLGTDQLGRDVLSRVLDGGRATIGIAASAAAAAEAAGTALGTAAAISGRPGRAVTGYGTRVLLAVPSILTLSVLVAGFGHSALVLFAGCAVVLVPTLIPVIATRIRVLASEPFIEAAVLAGATRRGVAARELLPNLLPVVAADFGSRCLTAVFLVSTAGFLGLGPAPPAPEWGLMINDAEATMQQQPWPVIAPAALLACLAVGVTILSQHVITRHAGTPAGNGRA